MTINMSCVKFRNTLAALHECAEDWDNPSNEHEIEAKHRLIELMQNLLVEEGYELYSPESDEYEIDEREIIDGREMSIW